MNFEFWSGCCVAAFQRIPLLLMSLAAANRLNEMMGDDMPRIPLRVFDL